MVENVFEVINALTETKNIPKLWHDFTIQTWKYHYDSSGGDGLYCVGINNNRSDNKAETNPSIQSGSSWRSLNKERYFTNSTNTTVNHQREYERNSEGVRS